MERTPSVQEDVELGSSTSKSTTDSARARTGIEGEKDAADFVKEKAVKGMELESTDDKVQAGPTSGEVAFFVIGHALSASSLVVVNKWALKVFPYLWTLTTAQFLFSMIVAWVCGRLGLAKVDPFNMTKFIAFFPAAGMFFITITAGNAVVMTSNVDTFIVMRSSVPIPTCLIESMALGEPFPPMRSWVGLGTIMLGAVGFASSNRGLLMKSVSWVILFMVMMPVDGVLIRHLIGSLGFTPWGMVFYNNLCASCPGVVFSFLLELNSSEAWSEMLTSASAPGTPFAIFLSCMMGLSVSFFQLNVRKAISASAFMVLGVANKFLTVLLNMLLMDTNREVSSMLSVLLAIVGAVVYQQTVKGNGMAQAPPPKAQKEPKADKKAFGVMLLALGWCAWITINQPKKHAH